MIAEKKVTDCHRGYIAAYLAKIGWNVEHIE
jgi:lambda repressor-like predicted transcriptional regulator